MSESFAVIRCATPAAHNRLLHKMLSITGNKVEWTTMYLLPSEVSLVIVNLNSIIVTSHQKIFDYIKGDTELQYNLSEFGARESLQEYLVYACRCALADLEDVMPKLEPSGERKHPGWQTMVDLRSAIEAAGDTWENNDYPWPIFEDEE